VIVTAKCNRKAAIMVVYCFCDS